MSATAPDGSPVGLYATLAPLGEPQLIDAAVPSGSEILELGCGAGRITHELIALGHRVTAVDNSAEMLAQVRGAETVLDDIESLDLNRTFAVVLLASNFLNDPEQAQLDAVLAACARHVEPDGQVLLERMAPDWEPKPGTREAGGVEMTLRDVVRRNVIRISARHAAGVRQPTLLVLSAIDNLVKGAAGQAVQNANVVLGINEPTGLPT